jgi:hypothetical protein
VINVKITIGYITAREEPHLEWLCDGIEQQAQSDDKIELIVVDALGRPAAEIGYRSVKAIKKLVETRPKPSIWQGEHRITAHDFFANANARNTATVLCGMDYICFLDDRCKLDPGWFEAVRCGEKKRDAVLCGSYIKHWSGGILTDHRRELHPQGKRNCLPEWSYGCNLALPLKWALRVNGFEEGCDPVGVEDCVFGQMLGNAGYRLDFVAEMSVQQDRNDPRGYLHPVHFPRQDKGQPPNNKRRVQLERFYALDRTEFTPDLTELREKISRGESFPTPDPSFDYRDWYDDSPIRNAQTAFQEFEEQARCPG